MFKIGEFAQMAQVSIRLLRHYDNIGLFSPATVNANTGYRYYAAQQLPALHRILALKGLGLSLAQIGLAMRDDLSAEQIRGMLLLRKAQIEQALRDEMAALNDVEQRLASIDAENDQTSLDVVVKTLEPLPYLSMRTTFDDNADFVRRFYEVEAHGRHVGTLTVVLHEQNYRQAYVGDIEIGYVLPTTKVVSATAAGHPMPLEWRTLPGHQQVLSVVQISPRQKLVHYDALAHWMATNNMHLAGPIREVYRELDIYAWHHAVIELQVPVQTMQG